MSPHGCIHVVFIKEMLPEQRIVPALSPYCQLAAITESNVACCCSLSSYWPAAGAVESRHGGPELFDLGRTEGFVASYRREFSRSERYCRRTSSVSSSCPIRR